MTTSTPPIQPPQFANTPSIRQYPITALLIAINVAYFAFAAWHGMDLIQPTAQVALDWGADYPPLTFLLEPYRLLSSMFVHFGLLHLAFNMWALYAFGSIAEPLWGRRVLLLIYFAAGLMGNLLSGLHALYMTLHDGSLPPVSAGASGAIMGLAGALTLWACRPQFAHQALWLNRRALLTILTINLAIGVMISAINQVAHVGGLLMGAILALFIHSLMRYKVSQNRIVVLSVLVTLLMCVGMYALILQWLPQVSAVWQASFNRV